MKKTTLSVLLTVVLTTFYMMEIRNGFAQTPKASSRGNGNPITQRFIVKTHQGIRYFHRNWSNSSYSAWWEELVKSEKGGRPSVWTRSKNKLNESSQRALTEALESAVKDLGLKVDKRQTHTINYTGSKLHGRTFRYGY